MERKLITSRELLAAAGISNEPGAQIPREHRHLLITSVLGPVPGHKLKEILVNSGVKVSSRDISTWLQATRDWLGLPAAGRGKPSAEYRKMIEKWRQENGDPTLEEIDAGWVPTHQRGPRKGPKNQNLSIAVKKRILEFRQMLASLDEAETDEDVKLRLADLQEKLKERPRNDIEDLDRTEEIPPPPELVPPDEIPPAPDLDPTDEVPPAPELDPTDEAPPLLDLDPTDEVPPLPDLDMTDEVSSPPDLAPDDPTRS